MEQPLSQIESLSNEDKKFEGVNTSLNVFYNGDKILEMKEYWSKKG